VRLRLDLETSQTCRTCTDIPESRRAYAFREALSSRNMARWKQKRPVAEPGFPSAPPMRQMPSHEIRRRQDWLSVAGLGATTRDSAINRERTEKTHRGVRTRSWWTSLPTTGFPTNGNPRPRCAPLLLIHLGKLDCAEAYRWGTTKDCAYEGVPRLDVHLRFCRGLCPVASTLSCTALHLR